ncbi:hypothetical protein CAI16_12120 [Virgibacillus dokdonensis]|uniref:CRISPR type III-associated protein domain-containing protein n=1 Tax=Virgibacillus dokdonensis TaxID=302167 RepID=A0A3E0WN50_9BACI|nr:RAMP superfamily CRISPR-associated protein [Virgibacillus dokdonensis]RFA34228.1 hypothetical protein CAI16_12120 [Virgibacillus dokdonensis]
MPKYELTITLDSDVSPGSGDSIAGVVDHDITHEYGIPIIPAKRLKGALRGVAKEFVDWGFTSSSKVDELFGKPGEQYRSGIKIYDAKLASIPKEYFANEEDKEIDVNDTFLAQIKQLDTAKVLPLFTMLYTKTATENGQAQTGSLRTIRAINRGLVFKSIIELENDEQKKLLCDCVKGLRHLGYGRTRGLGEVSCKLKMIKGEPKKKRNFIMKENYSNQEEQSVNQAIRITLQQPTLLAGSKGLYYSCTDFVPGSALLGVFASLYIKKHNLGKKAHKDPEFVRLFLRGDVSFGYAYPEVDKKVFMPCPAHIQRVKNENRAMLEEKKTDPTIMLRKINSLAYMQENELLLHEPAKEFRMHHARPENRRIGRAVNDTKGTKDLDGKKGQFYYYTALQKGQHFIGELKGKQEDVQMLASLLNDVNGIIHLGRSRTAEYGAAKVDVVNKEPHMGGFLKAKKGDSKVAIYLATPLTLQNEIGRYVADVELFITQLEREIEATLKVEKMYIKETVLTGYNAKWRLPKQEKQALDAGTVLIVSTQNKEVDWSLVEKQQWGAATEEGCGEIRVLQYEGTSNEVECISISKKLQEKQLTQRDHSLDCVHYIEGALENRNKDILDNKEAIHLAKEMLDELKQYSKSKIYQLEQYVRYDENNFTLPKSFPNLLKDIGDKKLKNQSKVFIDAFFHTIKLEVRKDGKETNQK